jgi:DNA-binding NarL/FixJ family response regulator
LYLYRRLVSTEREVLHALETGLDGHAIADQLHIGIRTEPNTSRASSAS